MSWLPFRNRPSDSEIDDEIEAHLRIAEQERIDRGESPEQARTASRREFGSTALAKEDARATWTGPLIEQSLHDCRMASRRMASNPWNSALAVLLLAVGVGASAVAFTAVRAVLFPQLPFDDPERVLLLHHRGIAGGRPMNFPGVFGPIDFFSLQERSDLFTNVQGFTRRNLTVGRKNQTENLLIEHVTDGMFQFLDAAARSGRLFAAEEFEVGASDVIVISDALAKRYFGPESPLGRSMQVDGRPHLVVGVMPPGFQIPHPVLADAWLPLRLTEEKKAGRRGQVIFALAQLRPEFDLAKAAPLLEDINNRINDEYGIATFRELHLIATPIRDVLAGNVASTMWTLSAAVSLVLLIACGNVAAMLLTQLLARGREIAMRAALGASTSRLLRQMFVEALALYVPAAATATLLTWGLLRTVRAAVPELLPGAPLPTASVPGLDQAVIGDATFAFIAAAGLCIATLLSMPLFAVVALTRPHNLMSSAKESSSIGGAGPIRVLNVTQVALTTALLIGTGLLVRGFLQLQSSNPGYVREGLVAAQIPLERHSFSEPANIRAHFTRLRERVEAMPGVTASAFAMTLPMNGPATGFHPIELGTEPDFGKVAPVGLENVSDDYFATLGIPLLEGRLFDERDRSNSPVVLVVNRALADSRWPGQNVIGKRLEHFHEIHIP